MMCMKISILIKFDSSEYPEKSKSLTIQQRKNYETKNMKGETKNIPMLSLVN